MTSTAEQRPAPTRTGSRWLAIIVMTLLVTACARDGLSPAPNDAPGPLTVSLVHLHHLGMDATVNGHAVRVMALYAEAPDYAPVASPERDGSEGIAAVDDAARAAIVYLRAYEQSGDVRARDEALGLLRFITAMEQGDGEYVNFIDERGRPNRDAPTSRKSMSWWAARSIWALGEAVRVFGAREAVLPDEARAALDRSIARMTREIDAGRLLGGSATATAEALLGLLALQQAEPAAELAALAARAAGLLVPLAHGTPDSGADDAAPWGARLDRPDAAWHAWGARSTAALATAAVVLDRPDFADAARQEADGLWARFILAGQIPWEVTPDGSAVWFPQIAYGVSPIVEGYLALAEATGERRYAVLAGLSAAWFLGANDAGAVMYDHENGRTFDGIDGPTVDQVNRNAGAESTIEALLALQAVTRSPGAAEYLHYRSVGDVAATLVDLPAERTFVGPGGARVVLRRREAGLDVIESRSGGPIVLTYWPAANPAEVRLATLLTDQWNRDNPDVQVRVQPLPAGRSTEEVLLAAIVARATPDVSSNVSSALLARLVRAGGVVRLDDRTPTAARLAERTTEAMIAPLRLPDGGIYAMPWKTNPGMLMYNVDLLAAAGIGPPRTHAELLDAFRRLARDTNGDGRLDRWAMWAPLKTTWFERFYDFYPLYLASSGGRTLIANGEVLFENEAAVAAVDVLRQGFGEGLLPRANFALGRDPFVDGTVALKIIGPWFLRELDDMKPPDLRYDVAPMPAADGTDPDDSYAFGDMRSIAIFSTTQYPEAAARFVAFLTSPAADRLLIEEASQLPYRRALIFDASFRQVLAQSPVLPAFARQVERIRDIDIDPDIVEIFDLISEAYEAAAIYGVVPIRQALARAAAEARKIVDAR